MCLKVCIVLVLLNSRFIIGNEILSQSVSTDDFWNEAEPFGHSGPPSPDLRLPSAVVPSFYRLKLRTDLDNANFKGEVYITIKAKSNVKEIIIHSKGLSINDKAKLTEQTYQEIPTLHRKKREEPAEPATPANETVSENPTAATTVANTLNVTIKEVEAQKPNETLQLTNETTHIKLNTNVNETVNDAPANETTTPPPEIPIPNNTVYNTVINMNTHVTHSSARNIQILSITQGSGDRLIIKLASSLKPDVDYVLELNFEGKISDAMTGFYKSTYTSSDGQTRSLGVTQFEPTSARAAFPCFDEPAFKAMFEISIAHASNLTALSNMKVSSQEDIPDSPGWKWTHFERSVNMSTYLVAYIVSDFQSVETTYLSKDNITKPVRIWTRPELINKASYALTITPILLEYYEEVFGLPYVLDKLDLIAIPDFSSGAMENWGLITFRETTLLFDPAASGPRDKQNVAIDVAHELAHQWFGNLVTMRWWTDLWLNEGFATYIEYVGVDHIEPGWNMFESFSIDKMDLLRSDSLKNTSPVSRKVIDASEISQKFDEISYTKGANLIRMLNHTVSEELFHKGLMIYLNQWTYTNAEENDLWAAMSTAVKSDPNLGQLSVVDFMNSWTRQAGYPVVNVNRNYETGDVMFEQKLFTSSDDPYQAMLDQLWHIPISYTTSAQASQSAKPQLWLKERSVIAHLSVNNTEALYVNVNAIGYYRVNYDTKNWELLGAALKSGHFKSPITKAQLIDDAFNLAKFSHMNYSQALGLTTCVIEGEDSKVVWELLLNNMGFIKYNIRSSSGYVYFQDYMKILLQKQLERLNFGLSKPKDDNEAFLIESLVMWECETEAPRCLQWAQDQFTNWSTQGDLSNNTIPVYLRSLVYNMAIKKGGRRAFEFFWDAFQNATDPNVKTLIINNLPSTRDPALITLLLERSLNELPNQYASTVWGVEPTVGTRIAQDFLIKNFDAIYNKFTSMDEFTFPSILSGAFGFITSEDELNKLKSFALQHKDKLMPVSQTLQKMMDTAKLRIEWMKRHAPTVNAWFKDFVTNHNKSQASETPITTTTTAPSAENATQTSIGNDIVTANNTGNVQQNGTTLAPEANSTTAEPEI
ncbi:aminopeptidase N-like isoform X2 [Leguminivora glycinivorella]|uniref:aminopeptidase N-like isoform X2 n=1 Tax=Leguminivora glycinivorella TaxID=1035111 RepID=UPI00200F5364|nr:aminopeptidase N-like isoform X2 [Leguminivora glycinivorella]